MKILLTTVLALVCSVSHAGSYPVPVERSPIITPEIAAAHKRFEYHSLTEQGDIVVCPDAEWIDRKGKVCKDKSGQNRWATLRGIVPKGRTFAGYSIVTYGYYIIVYWK